MTVVDTAPIGVAFGASAAVALAAWRARSLSASGAVAAAAVGGVSLCASWGMGLYLILWFGLATFLSKIGKRKKVARMEGIVEKSSQRDAWQVLANGGVYMVCATLAWSMRGAGNAREALVIACMLGGAGSLAASGADTWATEVGTLVGGAPFSLRSRSRVPVGTSGAITIAGTSGLVAGAIILALAALVFGLIPRGHLSRNDAIITTAAIALGGIAGALADTIIGAWLQERRWCARCTTETEQRIHICGTPTTVHRGIAGLNNDVVNVCCSLIGALVPLVVLLTLSVPFSAD